MSTGREARLRRLEPCRSCGYGVLFIRDRLAETVAVIRQELPADQATALIERIGTVWVGR